MNGAGCHANGFEPFAARWAFQFPLHVTVAQGGYMWVECLFGRSRQLEVCNSVRAPSWRALEAKDAQLSSEVPRQDFPTSCLTNFPF